MFSTGSKSLQVVPYDPEWPTIFALESDRVAKILGANLKAIHHVGSTSVTDLASKPKIDMMAVVHDLEGVNGLLSIGYADRGCFNVPSRKTFTLRAGIKVNLHIFEIDDPEIEMMLLFRDYLRDHAAVKAEYLALKYELLTKEESFKKSDAMYVGYTLGKDAFIQGVLKSAGFNRHRLVFCAHHAEWAKARYFRQKYFLAENMEDPYEWTFEHKDHRHLAFYLGVNIIGYAHIELLPNQKAAIRMIAIDEDMKNQEFGSLFLGQCEKWLKRQGVESLYAEDMAMAKDL